MSEKTEIIKVEDGRRFVQCMLDSHFGDCKFSVESYEDHDKYCYRACGTLKINDKYWPFHFSMSAYYVRMIMAENKKEDLINVLRNGLREAATNIVCKIIFGDE